MNARYGAPPGNRDELGLRKPPASIEAEQSVLGALLSEPTSFGRISDVLTAADFYGHGHRTIFGAIAQLLAAGQPVDIVTVYEQLEGEPGDFGGLSYLNQLAQSVPSAGNIQRHAEIVAERAALRSIIAQADAMATEAFRGDASPEALLDRYSAELRQIGDSRKLRLRRLPMIGLKDLVARVEERRYIVKGVVPAASIGVLFGGSGSFKSFIAVDAGLHIAHGMTWLGRRTTQGPVVYLAAEGGDEIGLRANAWHRARRVKADAPFYVVPASIDLLTDAWRVVETVQAVGVTPTVVIIDTLSQTFGGEENSANDVAAYMRALGTRFRDLWQCAVMVIHHSGHGATDRPRGSSAIQANTDYLYGVFRDETELLATLQCLHRKGGSPFDDATFQLTSLELGTDADGDRVTSLVARHLSSAEELDEAMAAEVKAGRGGRNQLLLTLLQNGMQEAGLRKAFYEDCGLTDTEARKKAYQRAKAWAIKAGFIDVAGGVVLTLKKGKTA